jgi:hypothetical protein
VNQVPVVVTVHGTFAGTVDDAAPHWWQTEGTLAAELRSRLGEANVTVEPFIWQDEETTGPNRESERRRAGQRLFRRIRQLDGAGIPFHLVGHSHGGSVIWHALKESASQNRKLSCLGSWTTVATPFLEFGRDGSVWRRIAGALAVALTLYWIGFWGLLLDQSSAATEQGLKPILSRIPLVQELPDIRAALGEVRFGVISAAYIILAIVFAALLLSPLRDVYWYFITRRRHFSIEWSASRWYGHLWLGIAHPQDEAINGLKATLVQAPDLVLRRRPGLTGWLLGAFRPVASAVDQLAWLLLMRKAQGGDVTGAALRRVAGTPSVIADGVCLLPSDAASRIISRADSAAGRTLQRFRDRLVKLSDQTDVTALMGVLSGAYDDESLIHTTMFEDPWVRGSIVDHVAGGPNASERQRDAGASHPRFAAPTNQLSMASAALAAGIVLVVSVLASAGFTIFIYGETNIAAAEWIARRFDDPAFTAMEDGSPAGEALVRALRLGMPVDEVLRTATKLRDVQARSQAYQVIFHEMGRRNQAQDLLRLVAEPSQAEAILPYRNADHLALGFAAALNGFAQSTPSDPRAMAALLETAIQVIRAGTRGPQRTKVLRRLIPVALALRDYDKAIAWAKDASLLDAECQTWDALVADATPVITDEAGVVALEAIIESCAPKESTEDWSGRLRTVAVGGMRSCALAAPLMRRAHLDMALPLDHIPDRFIECLAANPLEPGVVDRISREAEELLETGDYRSIEALRVSQFLKGIGKTGDALAWARAALKRAERDHADLQAKNYTAGILVNDAFRLKMLAVVKGKRFDLFLQELWEAGKAFDGSRSFEASIARLRYLHAKYVTEHKTDCVVSREDASALGTIALIAEHYPERHPSSVVLGVLRISEYCSLKLDDEILVRMISILAANADAVERADDLASIAPYRATLRGGLVTAELAGLPFQILKGHVSTVDRLRPSTQPQSDSEFTPIVFESISASQMNPRP